MLMLMLYRLLIMLADVGALLVPLLNAIAGPVIVPLLTSAVMWALNTYWTWLGKQSNGLKQIVVAGLGIMIGFLGPHFGLDVTSAQGFVGSAVALIIFKIGHAKGTATVSAPPTYTK